MPDSTTHVAEALTRAVNAKLALWDAMTDIERLVRVDDSDRLNNALIEYVDLLAAGAGQTYEADPEHVQRVMGLPGTTNTGD